MPDIKDTQRRFGRVAAIGVILGVMLLGVVGFFLVRSKEQARLRTEQIRLRDEQLRVEAERLRHLTEQLVIALDNNEMVAIKDLIQANPELCNVRCIIDFGRIQPSYKWPSHGPPRPSTFSWTPLQWAAWGDRRDLVELLLDKGADPNMKVIDPYMPLHLAACKGKKELAELLLAKGANPNLKEGDSDVSTPLLLAAGYGNKEVVELLLAKGADPNLKNSGGGTPLGWAVQKGFKEIAELLRKHGAKE